MSKSAPSSSSLSAVSFARRAVARFGRYVGLAFVIAFFGLLDREGNFVTAENFGNVANQAVVVAIAALGMTFVVVSGGIDLSVGSAVALASVTTALALDAEWHPALAALAGVATGALCGGVNGLAVAGLGIAPFVATLGTMSAARGVALMLAEGQPVRPPPSWLEDLASRSPLYDWMLVSPGLWLLAILALLAVGVMNFTVFGRHAYAIGANESAARFCGLPVGRTKIAIYSLAGAAAGTAGVMQYARLTQGDPTVAVGLELDVIAAVVIGGASLSGGVGTVSGTLVGAFMIQFLRNGCNMLGWDNYVQQVVVGGIIVGAVWIDRARGGRRE